MSKPVSVRWSGVKAPVGAGGRISKRSRTLSKDSRRGTAVPLDQKVFCLQLCPGKQDRVAVSYGDGEIRLFNVKDGENTTVLNAVVRNFKQQEVDFLDQAVTEQMRFPITMLRWKDDNVLISVSPADDGLVQFWDCSSTAEAKPALSSPSKAKLTASGHRIPDRELSRLTELNNATQVLDFARKGRSFATGGADGKVRVYDASYSYGELRTTLESRTETHKSGHSSSIVALRYHNTDVNLLLSAGMDNLVHLWDLLKEQPIKVLYGPTVGADGIDYGFHGLELLTGSYDPRKAIQIWDLNKTNGSSGLGSAATTTSMLVSSPVVPEIATTTSMLVSSPVVPEMKKSPSKGSSPSKTPSKNRNKTLDEDLENDNETNMQLLASFTWPQSLENNEGADEDKEQKVLNESTNNCGVNSVCFSGRSNYILATASSTLRILNRKTGDVVAEYEHENLTTDQDNPAAAGAEIPKITTLTLDADCDNCFIGDTDGIIHCLTVGEFLHAMGNESKKRSKEYVSGATPLSSKQNSKQREVAEGLFGSSGGKAVAGSAEDLASKTLLTGGN